MKDAGGSNKAITRAVEAETRELFDCRTEELYQETGGKVGDRTTLPNVAQKAYMVNETLSIHRLNTEVKDHHIGTQKQKDDRVVETVRDTAENVRKWLPW